MQGFRTLIKSIFWVFGFWVHMYGLGAMRSQRWVRPDLKNQAEVSSLELLHFFCSSFMGHANLYAEASGEIDLRLLLVVLHSSINSADSIFF